MANNDENAAATDYYYKHRMDQPKVKLHKYKKTLTKKVYLHRLTYLQVFSTLLIILTAVLQAFSIATNDWFVLNVNEYIPTSKGGLWYYCYIASNNMKGTFNICINGEFSFNIH